MVIGICSGCRENLRFVDSAWWVGRGGVCDKSRVLQNLGLISCCYNPEQRRHKFLACERLTAYAPFRMSRGYATSSVSRQEQEWNTALGKSFSNGKCQDTR